MRARAPRVYVVPQWSGIEAVVLDDSVFLAPQPSQAATQRRALKLWKSAHLQHR